MEIAGLLNGKNITYDYQNTLLAKALINGNGYISGLIVTTNSVASGEAIIKCTRTNGQVVYLSYHNTDTVTIDTTGTKKVWIGVNQSKLDDGSLNSPDGTGIASIQTGANYPSSNYIPLASISGGDITDERPNLSLNSHSVLGLFKMSQSSDIVSATTTDLSTANGNTVHITGTTTITSFGILPSGTVMNVIFDGALLLTHNATNLHLPGNTNIMTAAGDSAVFESKGSGNWHCISYQKDSGLPIITGVDIHGLSENTIVNNNDEFIIYDSVTLTNRRVKSTTTMFGCGTGIDGDVIISSGTTTLTSDKHFNNLTINSPGVLDPNGFKFFVKGTLSGNGIIRRNGNTGGAGAQGNPGAKGIGAVALNAGTLGAEIGGADGGNGSGGVGGTGTSVNPGYTTTSGVAGGAGGGGNSTGGQAGGPGGASARGGYYNVVLKTPDLLSIINNPASYAALSFGTQYKVAGGAGGGGGGGGSINSPYYSGGGGGGGGAGGMIWICANIFNFTGTIESKGGNGGAGGSVVANAGGGGGGGGGGGAGGVIYLIGKTFTSIGTTTVTGGAGGAFGTGTANNGVVGNAGNAGTVIQISI